MGDGFQVDPESIRAAGVQLGQVADRLGQVLDSASGQLDGVGGDVFGGDDIGQLIAETYAACAEGLFDLFDDAAESMGDDADDLGTMADRFAKSDEDNSQHIAGIGDAMPGAGGSGWD